MKKNGPNNKNTIIFFMFACSLYLLLLAWQILHQGKKVLSLSMRFGLWLRSILFGREAARKTRDTYLAPDYLKNLGMRAFFGGVLMFVSAIGIFIIY